MAGLIWAIEIAAGALNQDRAAVFERDGGLVVVLADGAGGTSGGDQAADALIAAVGDADDDDWERVLEALDADPRRRGNGETTAVIASVGAGIYGTSVGDSGAWVILDGAIDVLTENQARKPLVGAGCMPVVFGRSQFVGTLLIASDGLFKYAKPADIARIAEGPDLAVAACTLIELVRLDGGTVQDDVSIVLCRRV